ncbi:hydroxysqualene dehydroxylase HpnE [Azonexus fungiphilus]|uniref:hydroxysqualene dehydroxylase HpnE n=1 Tax=Azonexus fungiphilus TaxID=146940 RepID=UPI00156AD413|nr:FAD-dependent oxidoreductase [Azonexus fungiphilus]
MKVAVVGAGWAGLAAAVELTRRGAAVTLYEAGRVAGGRGRSVNIDGRTLDNGQHLLLGAYRETLALMRSVGADPDALFERHPLQVVDRDGFRLALPRWPAPLNVAWGLLTAATVDLPEKLKTALWMQRVKWRGFRLKRDESVADWLDAAGQTGVLRRKLWEPLCLAALNTAAERASAQLFANVLRDSLGSPRRADTDLLLPHVPFGELLPEPACRWLAAHGATLRFGHRVRSVTDACIDGEAYDAVVVAVAPQHLQALLPEIDARFEYEPIATVYLQFAAKTALPFPLLHLGGKSGAWAIDRGNGLFGCAISGHGDWEALSDEALAAEIETALGLGPAGGHQMIREKRATFCSRPQLTRPSHITADPRLVLAGDYTWADYPATLEGAVRSGRRAAATVLQSASRPA